MQTAELTVLEIERAYTAYYMSGAFKGRQCNLKERAGYFLQHNQSRVEQAREAALRAGDTEAAALLERVR